MNLGAPASRRRVSILDAAQHAGETPALPDRPAAARTPNSEGRADIPVCSDLWAAHGSELEFEGPRSGLPKVAVRLQPTDPASKLACVAERRLIHPVATRFKIAPTTRSAAFR